MKFASFSQLHRMGVLGMNSRNINYIARYNTRKLYPLVDNKLNTKRSAQQAGLAVPELLGVIENQWQLRKIAAVISPLEKFVIKPTRGSGGKGILVINERDGEFYVKPNGRKMSLYDIRSHISNILSGLFSLGGKPDSAMIEEMIQYDPVLNDYTYEGVPDIRIIVFNGFPVMGMLRCSTHASDGRANLHQGAIGVGLHMLTGHSLEAIQRGNPVTEHPDTGKLFANLKIPNWQDVLHLASGCYEMTGLGYMGCDIVLDKYKGAIILELNARPGLAIQLANGKGLANRLRKIEALEPEQKKLSAKGRVELLAKMPGFYDT
ncbi:MAG: alpha-L-glutamate ligase-like protein [Spongiibacteraceae bacterium]